MELAEATLDVIVAGVQIFATPPVSYFVALAFLAAAVGVIKGFIPRKKAK